MSQPQMQPMIMQPSTPMMQPMQPIQQQGISGPPMWDRGLCDCTQDCGTCLVAFILPCIQYGINKEAYDNSDCFLNGAFYFGFGSCFAAITRDEIRQTSGIDGSCFGDCCVQFWCSPCAFTQEKRQIEACKEKGLLMRR